MNLIRTFVLVLGIEHRAFVLSYLLTLPTLFYSEICSHKITQARTEFAILLPQLSGGLISTLKDEE